VPVGGHLKLTLPEEVELLANDPASPYVGFEARDGSGNAVDSLVAGSTDLTVDNPNLQEVLFEVAVSELPAGDYDLRFGHVRNPRTTGATDEAIYMEATDGQGDENDPTDLGFFIAEGPLDVLKMTSPGPFSDVTVQSLERSDTDENIL